MDLTEQSERMQSFYNLKHDPFGAIVDTMVFSGAGGRYEIAETIRHLMTYSHQDSLLVAQPGSGKRTVALQVLKLLDEQWRVAWIDGSDVLTVSTLLKELNGQLGLGLIISDDSSELIADVINAVASRYENEAFLLVVQYADQLPQEVLDALLELRSATVDVDQRIRQFWLSDQWETIVKQLSDEDWYLHALERLTDAEAEQYLKDRLIAAGNTAEFPIPQKDIMRLNQLAEGNPAELNESARDYMVSSTFKTTEKKQAFPVTHVLAGIAALALIGIAVVYKANESKAVTENSVPILSENLTSVEQKLAEAVAKVEAKQSVVNEPSGKDSAAEEVQKLEPKAIEVVEPEGNKQAAPIVEKPKLTTALVDISKESEPEPNTKTVEPLAKTQQESEPVVPVLEVEKSKASFFENAPESNFTMQLIGVQERENLEKLLDEFSSDAQVEILQTVRNDKPWFILIYGLYSSKSEAQSAFSEVPKSLGVEQPWVRSIASIRSAS